MQSGDSRTSNREVYRRAVRVALFVGTVLTLINQTPALMDLPLERSDLVRILLNYTVPFLVSTHSGLSMNTERRKRELAAADAGGEE